MAGRSDGIGTPETRHSARGKSGGVPGRGWRHGGAGGAGGKAEESCLFHPTPTLQVAPHLLALLLIPYLRKGQQTRPPARGAPPSRPPPLPSFPSGAARVEERLRSRAGRGETTVQLSERTTLKILPQVQLRKPCLADLSIKTMTTERKDDLTEDSHDIL